MQIECKIKNVDILKDTHTMCAIFKPNLCMMLTSIILKAGTNFNGELSSFRNYFCCRLWT